MARSSCIEHPQRSRYLIIRDHYLYMFDQDLPAAALLAAFENLCNLELDRLTEEQQNIVPWLVLDLPEVSRSTMGMYSGRSIQEALKRIEQSGLITVERRGLGKSNKYLFHYDRVQTALRKRYIFDGNFSVEEWRVESEAENALDGSFDGSFDGKISVSPSVHTLLLNCNLNSNYIKPQEPSSQEPSTPSGPSDPPPNSCTDLYEDMDSARFENISLGNLNEWVYILFTQMKLKEFKAPTPPSGKHRQPMLDRINNTSKEKVVQEIWEWFEAGNKSLDKLIASWKPSFSQRRGADTGSHSNGGYRKAVGRGEGGPSRSSAFVGQKQYSPEKPDPPLEALSWNERVSSRKWEFWSPSLHQALQERLADPDFVKSFDRMLDKCAAIAEKNHKMGQHITFSWLLKDDNWMRLVNGQYDYALKAEKAKRAEVDTSMEELIRKRKGEFA